MNIYKSVLFSFFIFLLANNFESQNNPLNVQEVAHVPTSLFQVPTDLSDIWGWVDSQGNEYALVGTNEGTSIFDLSTPSQPNEVFFEQGMNSIWRDIKTYGDYAYVTTEAQNGLLIIDMSSLPNDTNLNTYYYTGPGIDPWQSAHNLYIDDRGYAYIFGANRGNGGCIILDLNQNPTNPVQIGIIDNWYVHDGMVKDDTLYLAHISDGFFTIWDVSSPSNPTMLGQHGSVGNFCHNVWVSDDGNYLYTTDEISNGFVGEYNIDDLSNIELTDKIQTEPGNNVIPHNTHFLNNYIITSYYRSGIVVHDVSRKGNMVEVGSFDTSPNYSGDGFNGCWGVYPWLPSGLIIASDIEGGLYVLSPSYKRGSYLEGNIVDASNNQPISGVDVEILLIGESTESSSIGEFKLGTINTGTYDVVFSHPLYQNDTVSNVVLQNDSTTNVNVQMYSLTPINISLETILNTDNSILSDIDFVIENADFSYSGTTNSNGTFTINNLIPGTYDIYAGSWGFNEYCNEQINISDGLQPIVISLDSGYSDRFNLDMNWVTTFSSPAGKWVRDIPIGTTFNNGPCNPSNDSPDCGNKAFITGNAPGQPWIDDVDQGFVKLSSPIISLDPSQTNYINCSVWWKNLGNNTSLNDSLQILVTDNISTENLFIATSSNQYEWKDTSLLLPNSINLSSFHVEIITADWSTGLGSGDLVEAGFDDFSITNTPLSIEDGLNKLKQVIVYPNPTSSGMVFINGFDSNMEYQLYNLAGKLIQTKNESFIHLKNRGVYILKIKFGDKSIIRKLIF